MNQEAKVPKNVIEPFPKTASFIDFKVRREGWNFYKIEDGTLLKARVILTGILSSNKLDEIVKKLRRKQKPRLGFQIQPRVILAVESPPKLRGKPDSRTYTPKELKSSIIGKDMDFETIKEVWNLYDGNSGIQIKTRLSVVSISKTDKFESVGMPLYTVDSNIDVKFHLPDNIRKTIEEKKV